MDSTLDVASRGESDAYISPDSKSPPTITATMYKTHLFVTSRLYSTQVRREAGTSQVDGSDVCRSTKLALTDSAAQRARAQMYSSTDSGQECVSESFEVTICTFMLFLCYVYKI